MKNQRVKNNLKRKHSGKGGGGGAQNEEKKDEGKREKGEK